MTIFLTVLYAAALMGLSLYGFYGLLTAALFSRQPRRDPPVPHANQWPAVTIQLPLYNERYVVERIIDAAARLEYPAGKLQIQVVDDSTDDTAERAAARVSFHRIRGIDIEHVTRAHRRGFKAGALARATARARGELLVLFDADFEPPSDFLRRTVPYFVADGSLGILQARWAHFNQEQSILTAAQAIALDKHFAVDQLVRDRARLLPKFNGSASVLRRACLDASGGWQEDTVCEDLCLSTRAALDGWRFLFLNELTAPAQLPPDILAFKGQQARWAKGAVQNLRKYGRRIARAGHVPRFTRGYALYAMASYFTHLCMVALLLILLPALLLDVRLPAPFLLLGVAGLGQPLLFILSQRTLYPDWRRRLRTLPALLLVAVGLAPHNGRAVLQALLRRRHTFERTPKGTRRGKSAGETGRYTVPERDPMPLIEIGLALYSAAGAALALSLARPGPVFFYGTATLGLSYVAALTLGARRRARRQAPARAPRTEQKLLS